WSILSSKGSGGVAIVAVAARAVATIAPVTARATIAPVAAIPTVAAIALVAAHHRRRAGLVRVDAHGHVADHVLVDRDLALHLDDGRGRRIDLHHHVMRLAVLRDAIGEAAQTPGLRLDDLAAIILDDLGRGLGERIDLRLGEILTREKHMLVQSHVAVLPCWPIAGAARCGHPSGCRSKCVAGRRGWLVTRNGAGLCAKRTTKASRRVPRPRR